MSKAVRSDNRVNNLVEQLCQRGFSGYAKDEVDAVFSKETLKQCKYAVLAHAAYQYVTTFGDFPCSIHERMTQVASQSSAYRRYGLRHGHPIPSEDPFQELRDAVNECSGSPTRPSDRPSPVEDEAN